MNGKKESVDPGTGGQVPAGTHAADLPAEASAQPGPQEVTQLLADWSHGDHAALGKLTELADSWFFLS